MSGVLRSEPSREVGPPSRYAAGSGSYVADLIGPECAAMVVIRSELAHARVMSVDLEGARHSAGVLAAWSAVDLRRDLGSVPVIKARVASQQVADGYLQSVLATDRVRYVGEPIAVVVASDRYLAEDAAALVEVRLEPLEAVIDATRAASADPLFEQGNEICLLETGFGDIESAFSGAYLVEREEIHIGRHSGIPLETRGLLAVPDPAGITTIYGAAKILHANREALAEMLTVPLSALRMREVDVGGGFGIRGEFYPEDFLVPWAARTLLAPVAWIEDRREHLIAANHSREQVHRLAVAAGPEGELLGLRTECHVDSGAYVRGVGLRVPELTLSELPGPYSFRAYSGSAHCMVTNRTPTGTYRAPGRFEASFVRERMLDKVASRLGLSGEELRRRNLKLRSPGAHAPGSVFASQQRGLSEGDYIGLFERVVAATGTAAALERKRQSGDARQAVGSAVTCFVEKSGLGPFEDASVTAFPDGSVEVRTGASFLGQGLERSLAKVAAEALEIPVAAVRVLRVDTDEMPSGVGTYASRSMVMAGGAVQLASEALIDEAKHLCADELEINPDDLTFTNGAFGVRGTPSISLSLAGLAARQEGAADQRLQAWRRYEKDSLTYGFGATGAVATVDVRTGLVRVVRLVIGYDIGRAIDRDAVIGQIEGAAVQALGGALLETLVYDDLGNPLSTTLMDYMLPVARDAPAIEVLFSTGEASDNPLGARGAGEAGVPGVAPAVARAIEAAVGAPPTHFETPIVPSAVYQMLTVNRP